MAIIREMTQIPLGDITIDSSWKCVKNGNSYVFSERPTLGEVSESVTYSLMSGANIESIAVYATISAASSISSGISTFTIGGATYDKKMGGAWIVPENSGWLRSGITATNNQINIPFLFRANGTRIDDDTHTETLVLTNVFVKIDYKYDTSRGFGSVRVMQTELAGILNAVQPVCILNTSDARKNEYYLFDGVVKIQASGNLRFDENPEDPKEYVNGAKNEQDKVTLDVVMSEVHTTVSDLTKGLSGIYRTMSGAESALVPSSFQNSEFWQNSNNRVAKAADKLFSLKWDRDLLTLFTPTVCFRDMVLSNITITQDENTPYGWQGQLVFQYKVAQKKKGGKSTGGKKTDATDLLKSQLAEWIGSNAVSSSSTGASSQSGTIITNAANIIRNVSNRQR